jgi:hypothetical protein
VPQQAVNTDLYKAGEDSDETKSKLAIASDAAIKTAIITLAADNLTAPSKKNTSRRQFFANVIKGGFVISNGMQFIRLNGRDEVSGIFLNPGEVKNELIELKRRTYQQQEPRDEPSDDYDPSPVTSNPRSTKPQTRA